MLEFAVIALFAVTQIEILKATVPRDGCLFGGFGVEARYRTWAAFLEENLTSIPSPRPMENATLLLHAPTGHLP